MRRIPPILAGSALVGGTAIATAWIWLRLTRARVLSPGAVIVCTIIAVALVLAIEETARRIRRGRIRRAHACPHTTGRKTA
jgi:hypothetical protein